jgi:hypothetical protein
VLSVTPPGRKSRRLDSHQHHSAYKADAFLCRATSAFLTVAATVNRSRDPTAANQRSAVHSTSKGVTEGN